MFLVLEATEAVRSMRQSLFKSTLQEHKKSYAEDGQSMQCIYRGRMREIYRYAAPEIFYELRNKGGKKEKGGWKHHVQCVDPAHPINVMPISAGSGEKED